VVQPEGPLCRYGDTLPWFVRVAGNERLVVGIVAGVEIAKFSSIMM
jgi:hypothetical protein